MVTEPTVVHHATETIKHKDGETVHHDTAVHETAFGTDVHETTATTPHKNQANQDPVCCYDPEKDKNETPDDYAYVGYHGAVAPVPYGGYYDNQASNGGVTGFLQ